MDSLEAAVQITLKAMELKLIPCSGLAGSTNVDDIDKVIDFNSSSVTNFLNAVRNKI